MIAEQFDSKLFGNFLGAPVLEMDKNWGQVKRFLIDRKRLEAHKQMIAVWRFKTE